MFTLDIATSDFSIEQRNNDRISLLLFGTNVFMSMTCIDLLRQIRPTQTSCARSSSLVTLYHNIFCRQSVRPAIFLQILSAECPRISLLQTAVRWSPLTYS